MSVNNEGNYTKKDDSTIKLLEEAFSMDCPITEACLHANISTQTYYNWIEEEPALKTRFDRLRDKPFLLARTTVIKGIKENYQNAMDYLKRKKKKEFGDNVDVTTDGKELPSPIISLKDYVQRDNGNSEDSKTSEED